MAKYKIELIVESDNDYFDGNQIEDLKNDIEMTTASYNCFCRVGEVKVWELSLLREELED